MTFDKERDEEFAAEVEDLADEDALRGGKVISLEPTIEGYARIARKFSEVILDDVRKARKADDRALLVQIVKIAGKLRVDDPEVMARFIVALEQNENVAIMPSRSA